MGRNDKTFILFPRVSNHDGPARTLHKEDYRDQSFDPNNPLFNPLRFGYSDDTTFKQANKRLMVNLDPPSLVTQETRTSQRFKSNFKNPSDITSELIRRRRGR